MPYEEDKLLHEIPVERKKLGKILHKAGEWYNNGTESSPYDIIEGYVLEASYNMLQESVEVIRNENKSLRTRIDELKNSKEPNEEPVSEDYLNLMLDIKRVEKVIRRLDKRSRVSKDTDITVRCANAIGLLVGKKLLLIQAVTHVKK